MMEEQKDGGIVNGFVVEFRRLGVRAIEGEDVAGQLTALVQRADKQIGASKVGDPVVNKLKLISQLNLQSDLLGDASPLQAKALRAGAEMLSAKLSN
jgi:hypothetical protein